MNNTKWYAVRAAPGTQRMASLAANLPAKREGESIIERNLRNEGVDVYMPSFWQDVRHQRTNKVIGKRFPLLVGYVFVNIPERDFERVRRVEGVMCFLRPSPDRPPAVFRDAEDIGLLMLADMERKNIYQQEKEERERLAQQQRRNYLNRQLGLILPKGRRKKVSMRYAAEQAMAELSPAVKDRVLLILSELDGLDGGNHLAKLAMAS